VTHDLVRRPAFMIAGFGVASPRDLLAVEAAPAWTRLGESLPHLFRAIDPHLRYGVVLPDDPAAPEIVHYVAGVEIASDEDLPPGVEIVRVPDRTYAVKACQEPHDPDAVEDAWRDLASGIPASGRAPDSTAPSLELHDRTRPDRIELWAPLLPDQQG
jgi:predicted transcriptional regulator YdeE